MVREPGSLAVRYRHALQEAFALIAREPHVTREEADETVAKVMMAERNATHVARAILSEEKAVWQQRTGRCALCGGVPHETLGSGTL